MDLSIFLAWLIGPLLVVVGLSILINRDYYRDMMHRFFNDPQDYFFSGVISFVIGMAIVASHNLWVADWRVLITVTGWAALIKGVARLAFPQLGRNIFASMFERHSYLVLSAVVIVPLGLFLTWNAWSGS